jgi:16S rRNA (cytosine967-C5)-methyltransferase
LKKVSGFDPEGSKGAREFAVEILSQVERRKAYADILLDHSLKRSLLSNRDRALLTQLVYGTLRWRGRIDWLLGKVLRRSLSATTPYLRNLLRLTLYQVLFLDRVPDYAAVNEGVELAKRREGRSSGGLLNGVVRRVLREKDRLRFPRVDDDLIQYLAIHWSHPDWLVKKWLGYFGREETEMLLQADNGESPLVLRVNSLKTNRNELLEAMRTAGVDAAPTPWSPQGIQVRGSSPVDRLTGFQEGHFQVQGEASQLIGHLLDPKPGERVLDACSAPGGKATHLAELMADRGEIVATDISIRGLERMRQNVQRMGIGSVHPYLVDVTKGLEGPLVFSYDRILVDAPCSGLGTLRSHPEAKWHRDESDIRRLSRLQKSIVREVTPLLKSGGVMVYATCTLTREENEEVVHDLLAGNRDLVLEEAYRYLPEEARQLVSGKFFLTLPYRHNTDGFFAARMRKAG